LIGKDPLRSLSLTSPEVEDLDYEELFYNTIKSCIPQLKNKSAKNSLPDNGEAKGLSRTLSPPAMSSLRLYSTGTSGVAAQPPHSADSLNIDIITTF
jgi:hypothetical protein